MKEERTPIESGVAVLKAFKPEVLFVHDYETAVRLVLESVGWKSPLPKNQRVGRMVGDLLKKHGAMTYLQMQRATGLSVGAVANGLKACGAVVVRQERKAQAGKGSSKPTNWYGLPAQYEETTP